MENSLPSSIFEQEKVYKKEQVKILKKLSLTNRRTELANYAQHLTQNLRDVDFSFAENLYNLKVKLKEHFKSKLNLV